ncbi:MAG: hypothetical protein M3144_12605, partial [Actinomycetota bacterium]|nr:hypothetical protein [Actinomycetota bacterium]
MSLFGGSGTAEAPAGGRFPTLILVLRWATVTTGAVLSILNLSGSLTVMAVSLLLCLYTAFRVLRPLPHPDARDVSDKAIAADLAVALAAVGVTGGFGSPYVFVALVPILLAGFTQGYQGGFVAAFAVSAPLLVLGATAPSAQVPSETAAQVVLVYAATGA